MEDKPDAKEEKGSATSKIVVGLFLVVIFPSAALFVKQYLETKDGKAEQDQAQKQGQVQSLAVTINNSPAPGSPTQPAGPTPPVHPKEEPKREPENVEPKKSEPMPTPPPADPGKPTIQLVSSLEFSKLGDKFPLKNNLARKGIASASGSGKGKGPEQVFAGKRGEVCWCADKVAAGWLEAKWDPAVQGRYVLLFVRRFDRKEIAWGDAALSINNDAPLRIKELNGSQTIIVDLGKAMPIHKLRADFHGKGQNAFPSVEAIEIHNP